MNVYKAELTGKRTIDGLTVVQILICYFQTKEAAQAFVTNTIAMTVLGFDGKVSSNIGLVEAH
jgi:hypothetical protein